MTTNGLLNIGAAVGGRAAEKHNPARFKRMTEGSCCMYVLV